MFYCIMKKSQNKFQVYEKWANNDKTIKTLSMLYIQFVLRGTQGFDKVYIDYLLFSVLYEFFHRHVTGPYT